MKTHGNQVEREFERSGFKFELTGVDRNVRLWINGKLNTAKFSGPRAAHRYAVDYAQHHKAAI